MKEITGYEGLYSATRDGKIWGHRGKGRFLKTWLIGNGYKSVMLYKDGINPKKFLVHRLVALTYIPNTNSLKEVNHKNAERLDNRVENLEWVSSEQNKQHAISLGLYKNLGKNTPKGSKHPNAKLDETKVKFIRKNYSKGTYIQSELAEKFGVSQLLISAVIRGKVWKHVI